MVLLQQGLQLLGPGKPHHPAHGFGRGGPPFVDQGWWWGFVSVILPSLLLLALIAVGIWAVIRFTSRRPVPGVAAAPAMHPDAAVEELRLRYARGEMSREEFLQRSGDLSGRSFSVEPPPTETL